MTKTKRRLLTLFTLLLSLCATSSAVANESVPPAATEAEINASLDEFLKAHPGVKAADLDSCQGSHCLRFVREHGETPFSGDPAIAAAPFMYKACAQGVAEGCSMVAHVYLSARWRQEDQPQVFDKDEDMLGEAHMKYLRRACDLEDSHCALWLDFALGRGVDASVVKSKMGALEKGCDARHAMSCEILHDVYQGEGEVVDEDPAIAREMAARACEHQIPDQAGLVCEMAADMALLGEGGAASVKDATRLLEKACAPDSPAWTSMCSSEAGVESCQTVWFSKSAGACKKLAMLYVKAPETREQGQRVFSALCSPVFISSDNIAHAIGCARTLEALEQSGAEPARIKTAHDTLCKVEATTCRSEKDADILECMGREKLCKALR